MATSVGTEVPVPAAPRRAGCRYARALAALACAWFAVTALHVLFTGRLWVWLLPDLVPPLVFAAVPVLLLVLAVPLLRRRRTATAVAVAVSVASLGFGLGDAGLNPRALLPAPVPGPGGITVVSWNTEFWHSTDDPAAFYRFVREQRADVYLFQEYLSDTGGRPTPLDDLAAVRRELPGYQLAAVGELLTASRFPITAGGPLPVPDAPPPGSAWSDYWNHKTLRTDLATPGGTVSVYNVHVPVQLSFDHTPGTPAFLRSVRDLASRRGPQFAALARDVTANPNPVLVAGDLNTTPAMGELRALPDRLHDAVGAQRSLYPASWPSGGLPTLWRLDFAFTDDRVRVDDYRFTDPRGLSDHLAQRLVVSLSR